MALVTSYTTLKTAVTDWVVRSDLTDFVDNFIQNFESRFYRQPKNWGPWMEADLNGVIASGVIAVPSDYLWLKVAYVNGSPSSRLTPKSIDQVYGTYPRGSSSTGIPQWISRSRTSFVFGPEPDSAYTIKGVYWAKPESLTTADDDGVSHWMILNAPDILIYGALLEAEPFMKNDSRIELWQAMLDRAVEDYRDGIARENRFLVQEVLA